MIQAMMKMMKRKNNQKGFTLVELMVVVVIIGILTAIAVPVYNSSTAKANYNAQQSNVRIIEGAISMYQAHNESATALTIAADASDSANPLVPEYIKAWPKGPGTTTYSVASSVVTVANPHAAP